MIMDSCDKAKVQLPRWPMTRTPKRPLYEATRSSLECDARSESLLSGTHLTLTCVICHGHGCYVYVVLGRDAVGTNWSWELALGRKPRLVSPSSGDAFVGQDVAALPGKGHCHAL